MITIEQYFGDKPHTAEQAENATKLLAKVNPMLDEAHAAGAYNYEIDPDTGTQISGSRGGAGDGGFRLPDSKTGRPSSTHKTADGVDVFNPLRSLAKWITRKILIKYDLYREHPNDTLGWNHLQNKAPKSGCRTYRP